MGTPVTVLDESGPPGAAPARGRSGGRPFPPRRAFTLVEMMICLGVLGVVAAVAAPRWSLASARYRADALARRVAADLDQARTTAAAQSAPRTVAFNIAANKYTIVGLTSLDRRSPDTVMSPAAAPYFGKVERATFGASGASITFSGFGLPGTSGDAIFAVGNQRRRVAVDPNTGLVSVFRVRPDASGSTATSNVFDLMYAK